MATKTPLKYENKRHTPFEPGDTLPTTAVPISKQSGNRIEVRDGGIGVWDTAPPNLSVQYVDAASGHDDNPGTREKPKRTFAAALNNISVNSSGYGSYSILLKAGQTFIVNQALNWLPDATVFISAYDDPKYGDIRGNNGYPGYYKFRIADRKAPTLSFRLFTPVEHQQSNPEWTSLPVVYARTVLCTGVDIRREDGMPMIPGGPAMFPFYVLDQLQLQGCNIYVGASGELARTPNLWAQSCKLTMHPNAKFINALLGPTITTDWPHQGGGTFPPLDEHPNAPIARGPAMGDNMHNVITPQNSGFSVNMERKQILNGQANWDIFA